MWLESFVVIFVGICTAFCALFIGEDVGNLCIRLIQLRRHSNHHGTSRSTSLPSGHDSSTTAAANNVHEHPNTSNKVQIVFCILFCLSFVLLFGSCIAGALLDQDDPRRRFNWVSAMFAPIGALLRWRLSVFNASLPRFPLGTFMANILAVVLDLAIGVALLTRARQLSDDTVLFLSGIITGLGGSLSTVSTWILEAVQLDPTDRYLYLLGSVSIAQLLGLVIYGPGLWSMLR